MLQEKQWDFGFSAQKSRVSNTVTEGRCKERGKSDIYHERGKKNGSWQRKGNEGNSRNKIIRKVTQV